MTCSGNSLPTAKPTSGTARTKRVKRTTSRAQNLGLRV